MIVRREKKEDYKKTENLVREAFWNVYRPGCFEHLVLNKMRKDRCFIEELDYVIEDDGEIVAQIAWAKAYVKDDDRQHEVAIFGPLSVMPAYQGKGYARVLIETTCKIAKEKGYCMVLITGNPDLYSRFGFESADKHGIYYEGLPMDTEAPFFMCKVLDEQKAKGVKGIYSDPAVYAVEDAEVDDFDKNFELKIKERRPGQLV
ncbi:MAG: GNAT family N-acetyltransferase [Christensenellales bacterium]